MISNFSILFDKYNKLSIIYQPYLLLFIAFLYSETIALNHLFQSQVFRTITITIGFLQYRQFNYNNQQFMKEFFHQQPSNYAIASKNRESQQQQNIIQRECRICLSSQCQINNKFISPCTCKGSIKYAHLKCLSAWILKLENNLHPPRRDRTIFCELCKHKIKYAKDESSACCSEEQCLDNIQKDRTLFITLVILILILIIALIVQSYFLHDRVVNMNEGNSFSEVIIIALFLTLSFSLQIAIIAIFISSFFLKKQIQVTSIEQFRNNTPQQHQTFDSMKPQTHYSFSFI